MDSLKGRLIEQVKQYPALYDVTSPEYKTKNKDEIWDKIGLKLCEDRYSLKLKWKYIRDAYTKHLKWKANIGRKNCVVKNFRYSSQMEFCKPFLKHIRLKEMISHPAQQESQNGNEGVNKPRSNSSNHDSVDLLFLGLAKSVKTFSPVRQAETKLRITNLILEEEVRLREEDDNSSLNDAHTIGKSSSSVISSESPQESALSIYSENGKF